MTDVPIAQPSLGDREADRVTDVIESGQLAEGEAVDAFETEFSDYCGTDHGVATANGTAALHATLEAVGIGPGDGVVTTPFSFVATGNAIRFAGAIPRFADIDPETFNLDPHSVEETVRAHRDHVEAIMPVHLYGLPAEMDHLRDIADTYDLALVEDAAQAHGAQFQGERVGSLGDAACFSFYPTKNMTTGEGGMVTTDRDDVAEGVRQFVDHGRGDGTYAHEEIGHNFRMTDLAAAIGREQLTKLPEFTLDRRENAARLDEGLADAPVGTPTEPDDRQHVYHQYTIRTDERDALRSRLADAGVDTGIYYPNVIYETDAYEAFDEHAPAAEEATEQVLSLPVHPQVTEEEIETIVDTVKGVVRTHE